MVLGLPRNFERDMRYIKTLTKTLKKIQHVDDLATPRPSDQVRLELPAKNQDLEVEELFEGD